MEHQYLAIILSSIAGFSTILGGLFMFISNKKNEMLSFTLSFSLTIILFICIFDLAPNAYNYLILGGCNHSFIMIFLFIILGIFFGRLISKINIPNSCDKHLYRVGITSFIILMLHNIPEGIITYITSYDNLKLGIMMSFVIAMHNIPEGIMIALPIYFSTQKKGKGILYTVISGIAEPLGAILAYLFLSNIIDNKIMGIMLGIVCGMMMHIVIDDIFPLIEKYTSKKLKILGVIIGIVIMLLSHIFIH